MGYGGKVYAALRLEVSEVYNIARLTVMDFYWFMHCVGFLPFVALLMGVCFYSHFIPLLMDNYQRLHHLVKNT